MKKDAYIPDGKSSGSMIRVIDEDSYDVVETSYLSLHKYNLMSEKEFKSKHSPKLMFKEWEVEVREISVKVGCEKVQKADLNGFLQICYKLHEHDVDIWYAYNWVKTHKEELGL